tara:strand:+ start:43 stop:369 length:327 start_codon:yes stop_codon:yes gene_type:complete
MNKRYLSVDVYKNDAYGDSSMNGITHQFMELFVEIPDGHITEEQVASYPNSAILKLKRKPFASAGDAFVEDIDDDQMRMFGGNFVWSSDSRFRKVYPSPVPVHDRIEK